MNEPYQKPFWVSVFISIAALCVIAMVWIITLSDTEPFSSSATSNSTTTTTFGTDQTTETTTLTESTTQTSLTETSETTVKPPVLTGKVIALTFDDGPNPSYTPQILDILEKYNAKATFFVNGYNLSTANASLLKRMVSLGCEIGNHTENHKKLTTLTTDELYNEIQSVNQRVKSLCGYDIRLFRPPGGTTSLAVMQKMYQSGLRMYHILWNNDSLDWSFCSDYKKGLISFNEAVQKSYDVTMQLPTDGAILLMHDIQAITPQVLERVLANLSAQGYAFVTVSELIDFESMGNDAYFYKFYANDSYLDLAK